MTNEDDSIPPCPYCQQPGVRDSNTALPIPGSPTFYLCVNPKCPAPAKPHRWYKLAS